MGIEVKESVTGLHVEDDSIYFELHGKPFSLHVEPHMRKHIMRETEGSDLFNVDSSSPFSRHELISYTPELREMNESELKTLIGLFQEDIIADEGDDQTN